MIWGCFSFHGVGKLSVCDSNMNQTLYLETLEKKLKPTIIEHGITNPIHLDDSARPHRTKIIDKWHQDNNIMKIDWPGNSPDLNPIENLWGIMKVKLRKMVNRTKSQLIANIMKVWCHELPKSTLENLAMSMPNRINRVLRNKGGNTKY